MLILNLSKNEVFCLNSVKNMMCSKLHCQKGSNPSIISYEIVRPSNALRVSESRAAAGPSAAAARTPAAEEIRGLGLRHAELAQGLGLVVGVWRF